MFQLAQVNVKAYIEMHANEFSCSLCEELHESSIAIIISTANIDHNYVDEREKELINFNIRAGYHKGIFRTKCS